MKPNVRKAFNIFLYTTYRNFPEFKKAYRCAARLVHPDKGGDTSLFQQISAEFERGTLHFKAFPSYTFSPGNQREHQQFRQFARSSAGDAWDDINQDFQENMFSSSRHQNTSSYFQQQQQQRFSTRKRELPRQRRSSKLPAINPPPEYADEFAYKRYVRLATIVLNGRYPEDLNDYGTRMRAFHYYWKAWVSGEGIPSNTELTDKDMDRWWERATKQMWAWVSVTQEDDDHGFQSFDGLYPGEARPLQGAKHAFFTELLQQYAVVVTATAESTLRRLGDGAKEEKDEGEVREAVSKEQKQRKAKEKQRKKVAKNPWFKLGRERFVKILAEANKEASIEIAKLDVELRTQHGNFAKQKRALERKHTKVVNKLAKFAKRKEAKLARLEAYCKLRGWELPEDKEEEEEEEEDKRIGKKRKREPLPCEFVPKRKELQQIIKVYKQAYALFYRVAINEQGDFDVVDSIYSVLRFCHEDWEETRIDQTARVIQTDWEKTRAGALLHASLRQLMEFFVCFECLARFRSLCISLTMQGIAPSSATVSAIISHLASFGNGALDEDLACRILNIHKDQQNAYLRQSRTAAPKGGTCTQQVQVSQRKHRLCGRLAVEKGSECAFHRKKRRFST